MPTAAPANDQSSHHIVLSDGTNTIGLVRVDSRGNVDPRAYNRTEMVRQPLHIFDGEQKHSDLEGPWADIAQRDWSSGLGWENHDSNGSGYLDGFRINTLKEGEIILSGHEMYLQDIKPGLQVWPRAVLGSGVPGTSIDYTWQSLYGAKRYCSQVVTTGASGFDAVYIWFWIYKVGSPGTLTVAIYSDSSGSPNAALKTTTLAASAIDKPNTPLLYRFTISAQTLASTTSYHAVIIGAATDDATNYWRALSGTSDEYTAGKSSTSGSSWSTISNKCFYTRVQPAEDNFRANFCEYKGVPVITTRDDDGTVSQCFLLGDWGVADVNAYSTITEDGTKSWTADQWIGDVVRIMRGTGSDQVQNWRVITDNDGTKLTHAAWAIKPDTTSEYVIVSAKSVTELTTETSTANPGGADWDAGEQVQCMLPANGFVYMGMGNGIPISRLHYWNNSGTWTADWDDDGSNYAGFLAQVGEQSGNYIYRALYGYPAQIARAPVVDGSGNSAVTTALTFETAVNVGDNYERINGFRIYDEYGSLWILKEGSLHRVMDGKPYKLGVGGYENTSDDRNGRCSAVMGAYLYFSWHNSVLRYYNGYIDRIGPDKTEVGLPFGRVGPVRSMDVYGDILFAGVDAGTSGYSSVLAYNGSGWCEMWRAPATGMKVRNIWVYRMPGMCADRLYISCGSDVLWIPISKDAYRENPSDSDDLETSENAFNFYHFSPSGYIITSWFYFGLHEIDKLFSSITTISEDLSITTYGTIYVAYQVDNDTTWTDIGSSIDSFNQELAVSSTYSVAGARIRFLLSILATESSYTPRIIATILEGLEVIGKKYETMMTVRLGDYDRDARGNISSATISGAETADGDTIKDKLITWAGAATALTISDVTDELNDVSYVKLADVDVLPYRITESDGREYYLLQLRLLDLS